MYVYRPRRASETLVDELREHALVIGEVALSSGQTAQYYVDARRALLRPEGFLAAGELIADAAVAARRRGRRRPGDGGDPARLRRDRGARRAPGWSASSFARRRKAHGLQRMVEGPVEAGAKVLVVEDTVTTGGSTVAAIEQIREQGLEIVGGVCVVDRLAGGAEAIAAAIGGPFEALVTIDEIYPERPDR